MERGREVRGDVRVAIAMAVTLCCASASAQTNPPPSNPSPPSPSPAVLREAQTEFHRGVTLLGRRSFSEAVTAFERSLSLHDNVAAQFNLGLALRGRGSPSAAVAAFERVLVIARPDSPTRRNAGAMLDELRPAVARVSLTVRGECSELRVDGAMRQCPEGARALTLDPGAHTFEARREGYRPAREERTLQAGESVEVALDPSANPMPGRLVVSVSEAAATVTIDGGSASRGGFDAELPAGVHRVEVSAPGRATQRRSVTLAPGGEEGWAVVMLAALPPTHPVRPHVPVYRTGWFWVGVGAGVAAVAVTIAAVVLYAPSNDPPPYNGGSWNTVVQTVTVGP